MNQLSFKVYLLQDGLHDVFKAQIFRTTDRIGLVNRQVIIQGPYQACHQVFYPDGLDQSTPHPLEQKIQKAAHLATAPVRWSNDHSIRTQGQYG